MASLRKLSILQLGGFLCSRRVYPSLQAPLLSRTLSSSFNTTLNRLSSQYYRSQYRGYRSTVSSSNRQTLTYMVAIAVAVTGLSYAAVPLYRLYCQASGYGGTVSKATSGDKIEKMEPVEERAITVKFSSSISSGMRWKFVPQQREIKLLPGETALAFYTATNPTDIPITGIATYNVLPFDAGQYFNKIQCFCFEEQRLNPHEQVDMPVFFYIDPEFVEDPAMINVHTITLSYTLFEAKDNETIPNINSNNKSV